MWLIFAGHACGPLW